LTDEALKVIGAPRDRPYFLNLWYHTPHTPIEGKPAYVEYFKEKLKPGMKHSNPGYAAMIRSLDENVGRVLRRLEETGQADRTVVVFTSDNGGSIGKYEGQVNTSNLPLRSGKGSLYEGGIRVPLMIRYPGNRPGVCAEPVISNDFFSTIAEWTGAPVGPHDGLSLTPVLRDPNARLAREELYFHYPHYYDTSTPVSAIRTRRWKLLEYFEDNRLELYDLENDPYEKRDLANAEPDRRSALHQRLTAWRESVQAQLPRRRDE
jgi:arylsulfatase A-like enzyme